MLTKYSHSSSLKRKLTVVVIWLVAIALAYLLVKIIVHESTSFLTKIFPVIIGLFMIAGILLRCKIARGFTLVALYFLALFPILTNFLLGSSFVVFLQDHSSPFTAQEMLVTNIVWSLLFVIPIYFFSNNKSMDIFYIESNPKEHFFFLLGAIGLIVLYAKFFL